MHVTARMGWSKHKKCTLNPVKRKVPAVVLRPLSLVAELEVDIVASNFIGPMRPTEEAEDFLMEFE